VVYRRFVKNWRCCGSGRARRVHYEGSGRRGSMSTTTLVEPDQVDLRDKRYQQHAATGWSA
jgi:hypothetical protein